jgi:hypothetical protein
VAGVVDTPIPDFRRWTLLTKLKILLPPLLCVSVLLTVYDLMLRMPGRTFAGPLPPLSPHERTLRDELKADLDHLAGTIGERNLAHPARLALAADWIEERFRAAHWEPKRQAYDVDGSTCANIEVERSGTSLGDEIVLVGAHYDTPTGSPGANDDGSGVVAVLCLARELTERRFHRTIRFVEFVNEEAPYFGTSRMGSGVHAQRSAANGERIVAMLSLETMGYFSDESGSQTYPFPVNLFYPDRGNFVAFVGNVDSRELVRSSISAFRQAVSFPSEGGALPERTPGVGWSDHSAFWNAGYRAIMITDTAPFRYPYYHTREDTPDKVDVDRLTRVVAGLAHVVERLAD